MDVDSMILSQQQQGGDSSNADQHNYQQALSGFEQVHCLSVCRCICIHACIHNVFLQLFIEH